MKILQRYVLREFLIPLGYCLAGFVSIYVLFELFGSFGRIVDSQAPLGTIVEYFCAYLAPYFEYLAPAALMLATLYTMWNFCRHSELIAMRANGIGIFAIARPILITAALMAIFVGWIDESYVPRKSQWAKRLRGERFDVTRTAGIDDLVYRNAKSMRTWTIGGMGDADGTRLYNVKVAVDREDGSRLMNVTSDKVEHLDGEWWFHEPTVRHFDAGGSEIVSPTPELDRLPLRAFPHFRERPGDFLMQNRDWQFNSVRDRLRYLKSHPSLSEKMRRKYRYDTFAQIAAPFACIVITLLAIPAGITSGRQSVFKGILGALAMFFSYYALVIGCMIAADKAWLIPPIAAALPVVLFGIGGVLMFRRAR